MKKAAVILLSLMLVVSLFACSGGRDTTTLAENSPDQTGAKTDDASPSQTSGDNIETQYDAPSTEPEPVSGNEDLKTSDEGDHVVISGTGDCTDKDIVIPSHINGKPVTVIDEDAFCESDITSISIPWTVTKIDEDAFVDCKDLVSVTFSEGLRFISLSAFYGCSALKSITLPESLERISNYAFRGCTSLEEVVVLGNTILDNGVFEDCTALRSFTVKSSGSVTYEYGSSVFSQCRLETLVLGEGLTVIGSWCLADQTDLKEISIPESIQKIEACAFLRSGVTKVYYAGSGDEWKNIEIKNSNEPLTEAEIIYNYN